MNRFYNNAIIAKKRWWDKMSKLLEWIENIQEDFENWNLQSLTLSAIRSDWDEKNWIEKINTTDLLLSIAKILSTASKDNKKELINKTYDILKKLKSFHLKIIEDEFSFDNELENDINEKIRIKCTRILDEHFSEFESAIELYLSSEDFYKISSETDYSIKKKNKDRFSILWFWEILAQSIFTNALNLRVWSDIAVALDVRCLSKEVSFNSNSGLSDFDTLIKSLEFQLKGIFDEKKVPIISGYFWGFKKWIKNVFNRGYSDATAAAVAVAQKRIFSDKDSILQIQKSVDSILSADPWIVKWAREIPVLSYDLSRNITWIKAWAWAKVLNSYSLSEEVQAEKIKIHIINPAKRWKWTWTLPAIDLETDDSRRAKFVWWQKNITLILASSTWKSIKPWFFSWVADVVKKEKISMDHVYTTETWIMFTVSAEEEIWNIEKKLKKFLWNDWIVLIRDDLSLIWVFSESLQNLTKEKRKNLRLKRNFDSTMASLSLHKEWIPYILNSSWALNWVNTYVIERDVYEEALRTLHLALI